MLTIGKRFFDPAWHIQRVFQRREQVYVVQIGSNDGKTEDPLHDLLANNKSWRALLVEPVPFLFEKLRANYGEDSRFRFENVAIAQETQQTPFYYIAEEAENAIPDLPVWYAQLGSFNPGHISHHLDESITRFIREVKLPAIPLRTLLERNNVNKIDFLHIDTEGYDWIILRQLDLTRYQPRAILFEHSHLDSESKREALRFLKGDRVFNLGYDYFCVRRGGN